MLVDGFSVVNRELKLQWIPREFNSPATVIYKVPAGVFRIHVEVLGAGGGGSADVPGSDGGYGADYINVVPGQEFTIIVGAGGASGGSTGGTSSFGAVISSTGGATAGGTNWNPSHGTSAARINVTGGGSRGGARSTAGEDGRVIVWYPQ